MSVHDYRFSVGRQNRRREGRWRPGVPPTSPHPRSPCPATVAGVHYFTAHLHLAHTKLAQLRGSDSVGAHDAAVMAALYGLDPAATCCRCWPIASRTELR